MGLGPGGERDCRPANKNARPRAQPPEQTARGRSEGRSSFAENLRSLQPACGPASVPGPEFALITTGPHEDSTEGNTKGSRNKYNNYAQGFAEQ